MVFSGKEAIYKATYPLKGHGCWAIGLAYVLPYPDPHAIARNLDEIARE